MVKKPADYDVEDLVNFKALEERVYRLPLRRSVVDGHSLDWRAAVRRDQEGASRCRRRGSSSSRRCSGRARCPASGRALLDWPYVEGLRMDEAMHPLTLMVVGLYGKVLPNQNGAPLRVHIPWKYGFKSGKSIVRLRFTDKQPANDLGAHGAERVRVLRQRESGRSITRGGARRPSGGCRACSRTRRRRCSTATPTRWPASTADSTCAGTTDCAARARLVTRS